METACTTAEQQLHSGTAAPPRDGNMQEPTLSPASFTDVSHHSPLRYAAQQRNSSGRSSMQANKASGGTPDMRSVTGTPQSLSQVIANLPSSAFSFDNLPDFQSPTGSGLLSPISSARLGKKRPLSISPLSCSSVNIDALVRGSPTSLIGYLAGSRSSSAGSFGHLSPSLYTINPANFPSYNRPVISLAKAVHPTATSLPAPNLALLRQTSATAAGSNQGGASQRQQRTVKLEEAQSQCSRHTHSQSSQEGDSEGEVTTTDTSATATNYSTITESEFKKGERGGAGSGFESAQSRPGYKPSRIYYSYPAAEQPHNNRCRWRDCSKQCESLDELVRHVNSDHIYQDSKREFVCYWEGCVRDKRSFKAQYMLLVHMRRHTGEKPHRCHVSL